MNNLRALDVGGISDEVVDFFKNSSVFLKASTSFFKNPALFATIDNIENTSRHFLNISEKADSSNIIANLSFATKQLLETSKDLKKFSEELNKQIESLSLEKRVDQAFGQYDSTMISIRRSVEKLSWRLDGVMFNMNDAIYQIKNTTKQAKKSMRAITDNPAQVFFSEPPKPEK